MDLYTLTDTFLAKDVVDEYVSAIWTERYTAAGDTQLVVPDTAANREKLAPGTYLALVGSKEVMELKTHSSEDYKLTVVGQSLTKYLDERFSWWKYPTGTGTDADERIQDFNSSTMKPGEIISHAVNKMVIDPDDWTGSFDQAELEQDLEVIPGLELGDIDTSGVAERLTIPIGPLYSVIQRLAEEKGVGFVLYLESADPVAGFVLKFKTYRGVDRTTGSGNPLVRLSPNFESLNNLKEIRSIDGYKNVVYVWYQGIVSVHYPDGDIPEGFARRVLVTDAVGEPVGRKVQIGYAWQGYSLTNVVGAPEIAAFREQNAKDAFANNNFIHAIDGETSPLNDYKFGVDYGLGDIIELEGITGSITKARVTEYIRTQDETGEKEYPTISVVS